jgi:hypothetical protein
LTSLFTVSWLHASKGFHQLSDSTFFAEYRNAHCLESIRTFSSGNGTYQIASKVISVVHYINFRQLSTNKGERGQKAGSSK